MKKIYLIIILIPFFSIAQKLEGQKLIDSLLVELPKMKEDTLKVKMLLKLAMLNSNIDPKIGIENAKTALILSKKIKFNDGISNSFLKIGNNQNNLGDLNNAKLNLEQALKFIKNKKIKSDIYVSLGVNSIYQNDYTAALKYNYLSLNISEEINNLKGQAAILSNNAGIYMELGNYKKAIVSYDKALTLNIKLKNKNYIIINYQGLGMCYYELKQYKKALFYMDKGLEKAIELNSELDISSILANKGLLYEDLKQYDKALKILEQAYQINKKLNLDLDLANNNGNIGKIFLEKANLEKNKNVKKALLIKADLNILKALSYYKKQNSTSQVGICLENLSEVQKLQGNYKQALESHEQSVIYKDSVFNSENKETMKNLEDKREIELRDKQIKINKLSLEAKEKQKWLFVAGIGFLAIIGGLLFYQSRKRKLTNLKLETLNKDLDQANKAKTRFFGILNHDLRGPVSNLVIFLQLQQEAPEMLDEESTKRMQDKTMTGAKNLLASMEDILQWSKSQMENFKPQPKNVSINQLFDDTKKVFSGYLNIKIKYNNPDNIEIFTDDNYLKTIIRNLTSNAINVLAEFVSPNEKQIIWKAWQKDKISYLSITDNGPGANPEKLKALFEESELGSTKSGLGLHLIRDMAKAINCEISVESTIGIGTTFTLKL